MMKSEPDGHLDSYEILAFYWAREHGVGARFSVTNASDALSDVRSI